MGKNAKFASSFSMDVQPTMVARGPGAVAEPCGFDSIVDRKADLETEYTVRRLMPVECARLQGFPDWWCSGLGTDSPTEKEVEFWCSVFETYSEINESVKPKSEKQVRKWLKNPYSDSAEYKLWGNGVALPCVYFVLAGIAWAVEKYI